MRKYITTFKINWQRELSYRFNFFLGRLRSVIILILLYYLWHAVSSRTGGFANYTAEELFTYVFGVSILKSIIFGSQSRQMASEINDGTFSRFLLQPVAHFLFVFARELAERSIYFLSAILEVVIFILIVKPKIFIQTNIQILIFFIISIILAIFLYFVLSYLINMIAFWSREAMGPRFLFEWFLEMLSGVFFPLNILLKPLYLTAIFTPFLYVLFFPLNIYLGKYSFWQIITGIAIQIAWIIILSLIAKIAWNKGLKEYAGEGM